MKSTFFLRQLAEMPAAATQFSSSLWSISGSLALFLVANQKHPSRSVLSRRSSHNVSSELHLWTLCSPLRREATLTVNATVIVVLIGTHGEQRRKLHAFVVLSTRYDVQGLPPSDIQIRAHTLHLLFQLTH